MQASCNDSLVQYTLTPFLGRKDTAKKLIAHQIASSIFFNKLMGDL